MRRSLSPQSTAFVKKTKRNKATTSAQDAIGKDQYVAELSAIFQQVLEDSTLQFGKWKMECQLQNISKLNCTFRAYLKHSEEQFVEITFDPSHRSKLLVGTDVSIDTAPNAKLDLQSFERSSAFTRYFSRVDGDPTLIEAEFPSKQITSRHLGDYLVHLVDQAAPLFRILEKQLKNINQAA